MPTVSAARGCSPTARIRRPIERPEHHEVRRDEDDEAEPNHEVEGADRLPEEALVLEPGDVHVGNLRNGRRSSLVTVDVDVEVAREPEREEVDGGADHDLVGAEVDAEEGVQERQGDAGEHRDHEPELPGVGDVGSPDREERAHQHLPLEADVHDTAPLGEHSPDRRERQRSRIAQRCGDKRRPDDDEVEVLDARLGREHAKRNAEEVGGDR